MSMYNSTKEYGSVAKFFHWLIFLLAVILLLAGFTMGSINNEDLRNQAYFLHKSFGLLLLALMILRTLWTLGNPKPHMPVHMNIFVKLCAHLVHFAFYILLILMPIVGIIMSNYAGYPPSFFGLFNVIIPVAKNKQLAELFANVHEYLAWTIIALIIVHTLAALLHHYRYHDDVLRRMMPKSKHHS